MTTKKKPTYGVATDDRDETGAKIAVRKNGNRGDLVKIEDDNVVGTLAIDIIERNKVTRGGNDRLAYYNSIEELEDGIKNYWAYIYQRQEMGVNIIPDWFGFCSFMGGNTNTFDNYIRKDYKGFASILRAVKNDIAYIKGQLAMTNKIHPMVWVAMMNNQHGFVNPRTQIEIKDERRDTVDVNKLIEEAKLLPDDDVIDGEFTEK